MVDFQYQPNALSQRARLHTYVVSVTTFMLLLNVGLNWTLDVELWTVRLLRKQHVAIVKL